MIYFPAILNDQIYRQQIKDFLSKDQSFSIRGVDTAEGVTYFIDIYEDGSVVSNFQLNSHARTFNVRSVRPNINEVTVSTGVLNDGMYEETIKNLQEDEK